MTVISDVKKALEAAVHVEDRGRLHWFLGLRIRLEEGKVTVDQERYIKTMLEPFSNGSMQTLKNSSSFEFETSDSTEWRRRKGPEDLQKLGWITSVSGQTDEALHHVHGQHSDQTHECTYQSTLDVRKKTSAISSRFKMFKTYSQQKKLVMI